MTPTPRIDVAALIADLEAGRIMRIDTIERQTLAALRQQQAEIERNQDGYQFWMHLALGRETDGDARDDEIVAQAKRAEVAEAEVKQQQAEIDGLRAALVTAHADLDKITHLCAHSPDKQKTYDLAFDSWVRASEEMIAEILGPTHGQQEEGA